MYNVHNVNILEGLRDNENINVDEKVAGIYEKWAGENPSVAVEANLKPKAYSDPEMPLNDIDLKAASKKNEAAVIVISRLSGEFIDRRFEAGDYFLQENELSMINEVSEEFDKVILVLNVAGIIDTQFIDDRIDAVLYASLPGQEAGSAVADILAGKVTPSGKLTDTWANDYNGYSSSKNFGTANKNGNKTIFMQNEKEQCDVIYKEGIYVGYRYFDTFGKNVKYPFGFGLNYADLKIKDIKFSADAKNVTIKAHVCNDSKEYSGREVVQVYVTKPDGEIEKPYQELCGFAKTEELNPGNSGFVTIVIPVSSLDSYDESKAAYVLEKGYYYFRVGNSSRNTTVVGAMYIDETHVTKKLKNNLTLMKGIDSLSKKGAKPINYALENDEIEKAKDTAIKIQAKDIESITVGYSKIKEDPEVCKNTTGKKFTLKDVKENKCTKEQFIAQISVKELATLVCGTKEIPDVNFLEFSQTLDRLFSETEENSVKGAAGQTTAKLSDEYGIPQIILADGPAGIRIKQTVEDDKGNILYTQNCTAIPIGTLLASSWDPKVMKRAGEIIGTEMLEYDIDLWLAPGMNIHRNPLCGRNFEYYSEDPVISGVMAAAITEGVQKYNVGVTIKHFAGNNQEDDRTNSNTIVSERALREIYLKGFEIAIKEAQPWAIMTSYNDINGVPAADNYDLCTSIARSEWGFDGFIMTDWGGGMSNPAMSMYAGNDMIQPGGNKSINAIIEAVESGKPVVSKGIARQEKVITLGMLQRSAMNILKILMK